MGRGDTVGCIFIGATGIGAGSNLTPLLIGAPSLQQRCGDGRIALVVIPTKFHMPVVADRNALPRCGASQTAVMCIAAAASVATHNPCDMNVRDAMTPDPATCAPTSPLRLVAMLMLDHDCAAVPIVSSGEVLGIVTDRDIACRAVALGWNAAELPASAVMSAPLVAIHPDENFDEAVQVMKENHVHHLPVIDDDGRLLGIVAQSDLGRRMSNRELGQLTRETSIRGVPRGGSNVVRAEPH